MRLILIRHGDPDYEHDCLTEEGQKEAEALSKRIARWNGIKEIYVSPYGRAQETASYTLKKLKREAVTLSWLREFDYRVNKPPLGRYGVPWDFYPDFLDSDPAFSDRDAWKDTEIYRQNPQLLPAYEDLCTALDDLLLSYGYARSGGLYLCDPDKTKDDGNVNILLFCHFGVTCFILGHLFGISPVLLLHHFSCPPTGITILSTEKRDLIHASFRAQAYGDTAHLLEAGLPVSPTGSYADVFQS